jgi:hypothetical protein
MAGRVPSDNFSRKLNQALEENGLRGYIPAHGQYKPERAGFTWQLIRKLGSNTKGPPVIK